MSYSIDLRERVIKFIEKGYGKTEASAVFGVSRFTIYSWLSKKAKTGNVKDDKPLRKWKKIDCQF